MKKLILFGAILFGMTWIAHSQEIAKNAIGLRLGDSDGFGAEISYQRALTNNNRLEFGLGWRDSDNDDAFRLSGLYQWVFPLDGGFNWYAGAGGGIGSNDDFVVFAAGDIGIEYNFEIPLLLSLDFRPEIGLINDFDDDLNFDIALGIRYQF